jgi:phenylalanyl-tRNA synthetase alpha chain
MNQTAPFAKEAFVQEASQAFRAVSSLKELEEQRIYWLGKKGRVAELMKQLGSLAPEERKNFGQQVNEAKDAITLQLDSLAQKLQAEALTAQLASETLDVTLDPRPEVIGKVHPITQVMEEVVTIFASLGFNVEEGPQIEDEYHNFTALNIPPEHPARQMHDTFYLKGGQREDGQRLLLRTHTSPVQIRTMLGKKPPLKFIAPGKTYRCDSDLTHTPMFHQIEGMVIDKGITMAHLKGCLHDFVKAFFELDNVPLRFRASFFPFTEPSAEVDVGCKRSAKELKIGEGSDWLEILGCGMVHPQVLRNCGLDPEEWQGFAFGLGLDRLAMLKYGIPDLRSFFEGDARWLNHYSFDALPTPSLTQGL